MVTRRGSADVEGKLITLFMDIQVQKVLIRVHRGPVSPVRESKRKAGAFSPRGKERWLEGLGRLHLLGGARLAVGPRLAQDTERHRQVFLDPLPRHLVQAV